MISLKTLPQATKQEVFDQVAKHLLTQKTKATSQFGGCRYYTGGLRCAAGCLIADNEYEQVFEGKRRDDLLELNKVPRKHANLICRLQHIHDGLDPSFWYDELYSLAREQRLNRKALKEFK